MRLDANRIIHGANFGWSGNDPANRNVGRIRPGGSWAEWVAANVTPLLARGVRRFELHNPFGALADEPMQLAQSIHAREAGLTHLVAGFADAWAPVTAAGVEVIGYVGSGRFEAGFGELEANAWRGRAARALAPMLDAGMSIALDASAAAAEGSQTHRLAERLRDSGVIVYAEAKPNRSSPCWHGWPIIVRDPTYLSNDIRTGHPAAASYGIERWRCGPVARLVFPRRGETWSDLNADGGLKRAQEILADGDSVIFDVSSLLAKNPDLVLT